MKLLFAFLFLCLGFRQVGRAQTTDTVPRPIPNNVPTINLPVMSDSVPYKDTIEKRSGGVTDTLVKTKVHSPRKATIYSAVLPGLGQVYNRKYWKVPIVYAAIGIPAYLFFYNRKYYNASRYALVVASTGAGGDSLARVDPQLRALVDLKLTGSLLSYRNEFRRDMDYSILVTLIMWGLNIVDATVDAHLKSFDVSDDLTLRIKPAFLQGSMTAGVSLVVNFK